MSIFKKATATVAGAALSVSIVGGLVSPASAAPATDVQAASAAQSGSVKTENIKAGDRAFTLTWDTKTDVVKISEGGKVLGETTMKKAQAEYKKVVSQSSSKGGEVSVRSPNACDSTLAGLSVANGVIWTAAGLTAVAPPAAVVAGTAGVVTSALITGGGLIAC